MDKTLKAVLFDFDGVVVDTEGQYTKFWETAAADCAPSVENFAQVVKGNTLDKIFERFVPDMAMREEIVRRLAVFERDMTFSDIAGFAEFVGAVRAAGLTTAVVTSSNRKKMACVYAARPDMPERFDRIFTAEDCAASKPAPDCYISAAGRLGVSPDECVVVEDSVNGLKAAKASGATVVALTTTCPREDVEPYAQIVAKDFTELSLESVRRAFGEHRREKNNARNE